MNKLLADRMATTSRRRRSDAGVALVMTLGIMLVGIVVIASVAIIAVNNANNTVNNREEMTAFQSADAGLDWAISILASKTHDQIGSACATEVPASMTINGDQVAIAQEYTVTRGGASVDLPLGTCPLSTDATKNVTLYATATTTGSLDGNGPFERTAVAELIPIPPSILLDKAIFSNATVNLVSNTVLEASEGATEADAHVYSNGGVNCNSNLLAGGSVYAAQGNVTLDSGCDIDNSVWASGRVLIKSGTVNGDVYAAASTLAAGGYAVELSGAQSEVSGSILTNGDVLISKSKTVTGNIYASTGSVWVDAVDVLGSVYAGGAIDLKQAKIGTDGIGALGAITGDNNAKTQIGRDAVAALTITGVSKVGGDEKPLTPTVSWPEPAEPDFGFVDVDPGYPDAIEEPLREDLPQLTMTDDDQALWSAAGWTIEKYSGVCTAAQIDPLISGGLSVGAGRMLIFEGCASPVEIITSDVTLSTNIALVSRSGFTNQNASNINNGTGGDSPVLYMIVPAESVPWSGGNPSCPASELYDIRVGAFKMNDVKVFAYTPCDFDYKTSISSASDPWEGQIYAGAAFPGSGAFKLQMAQVPVPSAVEETPDLTLAANLTVIARYDERG